MPVKPRDERSGYSASPIGREGISTRTLETSLFLSRLSQLLPQLPPVQRKWNVQIAGYLRYAHLRSLGRLREFHQTARR